METDFIVFVEGPVNEDEAMFEAYKGIQNSMVNDLYIGLVPTILGLEFLSPLPLPVPPGSGGETPAPIPVSANRQSASVSPWMIGASVASIMGAFASILLWARARRYRQRRQQLMDDTYNGSPITE